MVPDHRACVRVSILIANSSVDFAKAKFILPHGRRTP